MIRQTLSRAERSTMGLKTWRTRILRHALSHPPAARIVTRRSG